MLGEACPLEKVLGLTGEAGPCSREHQGWSRGTSLPGLGRGLDRSSEQGCKVCDHAGLGQSVLSFPYTQSPGGNYDRSPAATNNHIFHRVVACRLLAPQCPMLVCGIAQEVEGREPFQVPLM